MSGMETFDLAIATDTGDRHVRALRRSAESRFCAHEDWQTPFYVAGGTVPSVRWRVTHVATGVLVDFELPAAWSHDEALRRADAFEAAVTDIADIGPRRRPYIVRAGVPVDGFHGPVKAFRARCRGVSASLVSQASS